MSAKPGPMDYVDGRSNITISYDQLPRPYHHVVAQLVLERRSQGTLLDYGCGVGNTTAEIVRLGGRFDVTLADPDDECLRRASARVPGSRTMRLDESQNAAALSTFDVVLLSHVLQYVPEPLQLLRYLVERVRPGGFVVIATPNPVTPTKVLHHLRRRRYSEGLYAWDRHSLTTLVERGAGARVTRTSTDFVPLPGASRWKLITSAGEALIRAMPMLGFSIIQVIEPLKESGEPC